MLVNGKGQLIELGPLLGKGGEGAVHSIKGLPDAVAKVYHHPLTPEREEKLRFMGGRVTPQLTAISAWPLDVLCSKGRPQVVGVVMPKVEKHKEVHQIYSPAQRKNDHPQLTWKFLVHVAMNCAGAFEAIHQDGHVVGDVNQGGILVSPEHGTVKLIDCDSFQIRSGPRTFYCTVSVPQYTPPELVGKDFSITLRSANHDCFGLALLVFHLLFMGRHPFAGRYLGSADMTIEQAIAEARYVFARDAAKRLMAPPPRSVGPMDLCPHLADLFERAFTNINGRPTATEWHSALKALRDNTVECAEDKSHVYSRTLGSCPWCKSEHDGAPPFFVTSVISFEYDAGNPFEAILARIRQINFEFDLTPFVQGLKSPAGRPWPKDSDPHAAGKELPIPAPLPPANLESLPPLPPYADPPAPPRPVFRNVPSLPVFAPVYSEAEPRRPDLPPLPQFAPLPVPEHPVMPPEEPLPPEFPAFNAAKAQAEAFAEYGHSRRVFALFFFYIPCVVAAIGAGLAYLLDQIEIAVPTGLVAFALSAAVVIIEVNKRRWIGTKIGVSRTHWQTQADAAARRRQRVIVANSERHNRYENLLQVFEKEIVRIEAESLRLRNEVEILTPVVEAERQNITAKFQSQHDQWEQRMAVEQQAARESWRVEVAMVEKERRSVEAVNSQLEVEWAQRWESAKEIARREWHSLVDAVRLERDRVSTRNDAAKKLHGELTQKWEAQVAQLKAHNGEVYKYRARWLREVDERQRAFEQAKSALAELKANFERSESYRVDFLDKYLQQCALITRDFKEQQAAFENERNNLAKPAAAQQMAKYLDTILIEGAGIKGLGEGSRRSLAQYGIETAYDVTASALDAVTGFKSGQRRQGLLDWRRQQELAFRFDPQAAVRPIDMKILHTRYKARRIAATERLAALERQIRVKLSEFAGDRNGAGEEFRKRSLALLTAEADLKVAPTL